MRRIALVVMLSVGTLLWMPGVAMAHAGFVSGSPEPGSELGTAPGVVILRFSEPLNASLSRATVTTPDGHRVDGTVSGGEEITVDLSTNAQGVYGVTWTTVSLVDGHTLTGSFRFGVGVPAGPGAEGATATSPRTTDLLIAVGRVAEDMALLLAIGLLLLTRLGRRAPALSWVRARPTAALAAALVGGSMVVLGEALAAAGRASARPIASYLTTGVPGMARLARPALELLALGLALRGSRFVWVPLGAALISLAAAGHGAAVSPQWWGIAVEFLHLLTASLWAGGILALAFQRPPDGWRGPDGGALLDRFTPVALLAFACTAATGVLRGVQEVGSWHDLFTSSYGLALVIKSLLVLLLVQFSVFAWRRIVIRPRIEASVAVAVVGVAALLAAYPLPPARFEQAVAAEAAPQTASALPKLGDLTLGSHAGQFLIGLTVRLGSQDLAIYLHGLGSDVEVGARSVAVRIDGRAAAVQQCAPTCRTVSQAVRAGDEVDVTVEGDGGGTARFRIPDLNARPGDGVLARMMTTMHALSTYRQTETLTSGQAIVRASYAFKAPDTFESRVVESGGATGMVWIGKTRYLQLEPGGSWQVEVGVAPTVPVYVWDSFQPFLDARVIGKAKVDGLSTQIVAFFGDNSGLPIWFRLWTDRTGFVHRAEMRALGHFMNHHYFAFNKPLSIEPPPGALTGGAGNSG